MNDTIVTLRPGERQAVARKAQADPAAVYELCQHIDRSLRLLKDCPLDLLMTQMWQPEGRECYAFKALLRRWRGMVSQLEVAAADREHPKHWEWR
jgi:hypothetical protein